MQGRSGFVRAVDGWFGRVPDPDYSAWKPWTTQFVCISNHTKDRMKDVQPDVIAWLLKEQQHLKSKRAADEMLDDATELQRKALKEYATLIADPKNLFDSDLLKAGESKNLDALDTLITNFGKTITAETAMMSAPAMA